MLLTIEKVLVLKSVGFFAEIPEEYLVEVAQTLSEVHVEANEKIFEKGDVGASLFIIVEGKVRIHDGDQTFTFAGPREVFGELSVLDPEPRSASVTAAEDTFLFRLDGRVLYELMSEHPGVARGIIRMLCRRLRSVADRES